MVQIERQNLDLSGIGTASGGTYQDVRVQGIGRVHGDLDCIHCVIEGVSEVNGDIQAVSVHMHGKAKVLGNVQAQAMVVEGVASVTGTSTVERKLTIHGKAKMGGDLIADSIIIDGTNHIEGDCRAHDMKLRGRTAVTGTLTADEVLLHGSVRVGGSCQAETFRSDGAFRIDGLLTADKVYIRHECSSFVKEIGGEEIRVERGRSRSWFGRNRHLTVETVEGDDIYLEYTTAKLVRGNRITLGPSVHIERVEYHTELRHKGKVQIGSRVQI